MNSSVCIDANLIIRALAPGSLSDNVLALLLHWQQQEITLIAPALLAFEVTSTLRRLVYLREITPAEGEEAFAQFLRFDIRLSHRRSLFPLAWNLAKEHQRPRAYDTAYLALAQLNECEFWTADERLYNAVHQTLAWVKWVGEYPPLH